MSCDDLVWFFGPRVREEVERDAERLPVAAGTPGGSASTTSFGVDALVVGADGDRRAVLVAAGHHQHVVAAHAVVAGEDVGRQVGAGDVAEVQRPVRVRPGDGDEDGTAGL